ncbi:hypothetical protein CDD83_3511 [Cordyceps sp. RAO-2017]|nr:hypothetical protein CDD83_3511 [Cordyceps sp. RAO-2017]
MSSLIEAAAHDDLETYRCFVASALEICRIGKILDFNPYLINVRTTIRSDLRLTCWATHYGSHRHSAYHQRLPNSHSKKTVPAAPLRVLDAPSLRDDFYCSVLAYSATCQTLAICLGNLVYTWSERFGPGKKTILAAGRSDGSVVLMCHNDGLPRFEVQQPHSVTCTEELVVGDETGTLYYYVVEWSLTQQICGLAWSPCAQHLASGGNDNLCCLFDVSKILGHAQWLDPKYRNGRLVRGQQLIGDHTHHVCYNTRALRHIATKIETGTSQSVTNVHTTRACLEVVQSLGTGCATHLWIHQAAVKAIAFCPWRTGLIATGGGSNDKCIHFFHTTSGSALATIAVGAQVTSLIWSTTRREIAATFGYSQPEHFYRVAIFSWPECQQVAVIPWKADLRALYAIPYPSRIGVPGGPTHSLGSSEGCIVIASSDETVRFHEVWSAKDNKTVAKFGLLGGSDVLEDLDGMTKENDIIR